MAKLIIESGDDLAEQVRKLDKDLREVVMREMLNAGGDVLVEAWKDKIEAKYHVVTGDMLDSVSKTSVKIDATSASIEVYPQGTDSHRVKNAEKAFVISTGRGPNKAGNARIVGDHFVDEIEAESKARIDAAMQAVLDKYTSGKE